MEGRIMKPVAPLILASAVFLLPAVPATAIAEDTYKEAYAEMSIYSHYVWRGTKLSDKAVLQPNIGFIYNNFGFDLWSNYDLENNEHNETDYTLDYTISHNLIEVIVGYVHYANEGPESSETSEFFLSTSYDTLLSPSLTLYYDNDEGDGGFVELSGEHTVNLADSFDTTISAVVSYNMDHAGMGTDEDGKEFSNLYHAEVSISIPFELNNDISLEAVAAHAFALNDDSEYAISDNSNDGDDSVTYVGVTASLSF